MGKIMNISELPGRKVRCKIVSAYAQAHGVCYGKVYTIRNTKVSNSETLHISLKEVSSGEFIADCFVFVKEVLDFSDVLNPCKIYVDGAPVKAQTV